LGSDRSWARIADGGQVPLLISVDEVRRMRWKSEGRHSVRLISVLDLLLAQLRPQRLVLPNTFDLLPVWGWAMLARMRRERL
jgi:hypothetical protein